MVEIFIGLPRTGKTFRAVHYVKTRFLNPEHKEYKKHRYLYTNIGGFKFEKVNEILLSNPIHQDNDVYIKESKELKWSDFYEHITYAYNMAQDEKSDDELIEYLKQHDYYPALMIFDESYRYFTKKSDPVLVWFLAYHGHMGFDVIHITQSTSLMHSDYKQFTEFYYEALPKSKGLSNNVLRYEHKTNDGVKFSSDKLKADKDIFALYKSGDIHKPKKIIYKFIVAGVLLLAFLGFVLYSMFDRLSPDTPKNENNVTRSSSASQTISYSNDTFILTLRCNDSACWNVDNKFEDNQISLSYLLFLVDKFKIKLDYFETKTEIYRLTKLTKGYKKIVMASLTDFVYEVPKELKTNHLKGLFIPRSAPEPETSLASNFMNGSGSLDVVE